MPSVPAIFAVQRHGDRWIVRAPTMERFGDGIGIVAAIDTTIFASWPGLRVGTSIVSIGQRYLRRRDTA